MVWSWSSPEGGYVWAARYFSAGKDSFVREFIRDLTELTDSTSS